MDPPLPDAIGPKGRSLTASVLKKVQERRKIWPESGRTDLMSTREKRARSATKKICTSGSTRSLTTVRLRKSISAITATTIFVFIRKGFPAA